MSKGKSIMVDTSRCTACRGCQVACKQWNGLPGTKTKQTRDLSKPARICRPRPGSSSAFPKGSRKTASLTGTSSPNSAAIVSNLPAWTPSAAYARAGQPRMRRRGRCIFTDKSKEAPFEEVRTACPYNIPRQDEKTKVLVKCTCAWTGSPITGVPSCVLSCPTGAMTFGDRDAILDQAKKRVEVLKTDLPQSHGAQPG